MNSQNPLESLGPEDLERIKKDFQEKLFRDLGLAQLPKNEKENFVEKVNQQANETILNTIIANLDDTQIDSVDKKMEEAANDEERARTFLELAKDIPDMDKKIISALNNLYQQMVESAKKFDQTHPKTQE